ncbi:MAG: hypothetical protein IJE08_13560 [Clostridia bacterium]|nr:hypothetical protein [Clostridia bacterium]
MISANELGFLPGKSGVENAKALQRAVDFGGTVTVDLPGVYDLAETVLIGDDTELIFRAGVYIRRAKDDEGNQQMSYVFVNKGAFTREWNKNIAVRGLKLMVNDMETEWAGRQIVGLIGHVSFYYIKNLVIDEFECLDLRSHSFCIQICTFENIRVENVHIEGRKDGVHLGRGSKFVIRNGIFRTYDDPIALNAHDYATSNPQLGWIEDGVIENCYDLDDEDTTGFFCRILAGSWLPWYKGMKVQHSDTVVANGRLYRVCMKADWTEYVSETCPCHEDGAAEYDGINWVMVQEGEIENCGCRNIHFKDIFLQKNRPIGFAMHFDHDQYSRSVYPGSKAPVQEDLIFENIFFENNVPILLRSTTPVNTIKLVNSVLTGSRVDLGFLPEGTVTYPKTQILLSGTTFRGEGEHLIVRCGETRSADLKILGSIIEDDSFRAKIRGDIRVISSDIELEKDA